MYMSYSACVNNGWVACLVFRWDCTSVNITFQDKYRGCLRDIRKELECQLCLSGSIITRVYVFKLIIGQFPADSLSQVPVRSRCVYQLCPSMVQYPGGAARVVASS